MIGLTVYLAISFIAGLTLLSFVRPPTRAIYDELRERGPFE